MKRTTFVIALIFILGCSMNIHAQICKQVIYPGCPGDTNGQLRTSPTNSFIKSFNPTCGDSIKIHIPPEHGTVIYVDSLGNIEDTIHGLNFLYEPNTNCFSIDSFKIKIYDLEAGTLLCDSVTYILDIEFQCDTPDDIFCCIPPDSNTNTLDILVNDTTFIQNNYDFVSFTIDTVDSVILQPANGVLESPQVNPFFYTPDMGFTGVDSFAYTVTYMITDSTDTYVICDTQTCYIFVEDCLSTMPDGACLSIGDTVCIDPLANDIVEPTLYHPILDVIGCTNPDPLPVLDPTTLTQPVPIDGGDTLTYDGMGGWCFVGTSSGTYTYTYEVCTDASSCAIDTIRFGVFSECICDDYIALRALYLNTNGDCWTNTTGWPDAATFLANSYSPPPGFMGFDNWYGINVNPPTGCVANIYLPNNNLKGTLPPDLGLFADRLGTLRLEENQIYGNIPPELGNLTQLNNLILDNNELSGRIPGTLENISTLTCLSLYNNQLSGCYDTNLSLLCSYLGGSCNNNASISDGNNFDADWEDFCATQAGLCICLNDDYTALRALYLSTDGDNWNNNNNWPPANNFPTTPPSGTNLSTWNGVTVDAGCVTALNLQGNNLDGTIPSDLDKLCKITYLNLGNNQLIDNIPAELGNMANLTYLDLSQNQLTGSLTAELGYLRNLNVLSVKDNQLTGSFDIKLLDLCNQLGAALVDTGNNFNTTWANFCISGGGTCYCPFNDNIGGTISSDTYQAAQTITSSGEVSSGENVMLKAGELIKLDTGFTVQPNADFSGEIEDCTPQ